MSRYHAGRAIARRLARPLLTLVLAYLRSRPRQKALAMRLLALSPRLGARLRLMAARQATSFIVGAWTPVQTRGGQLDPLAYPASVRASFARLIEARSRADAANR